MTPRNADLRVRPSARCATRAGTALRPVRPWPRRLWGLTLSLLVGGAVSGVGPGVVPLAAQVQIQSPPPAGNAASAQVRAAPVRGLHPIARGALTPVPTRIPFGQSGTTAQRGATGVQPGELILHSRDTIVQPGEVILHSRDTIVQSGDTIVQAGDTIVQAGDTIVQAADTIVQNGDTIVVPADTVPEEDRVEVRNLPTFPRPVPPGWQTGVWEWDREGIQASRAMTLAELLEQVPGVLALRSGDYGNPTTVVSTGLGPGRVRIFVDGAELAPLDGGVVDLSRVGLVGLDRVRVERRPGELRIELLGLQMVDPRAYSLLEVGTGDLQTNIFRGTFAHPDALGGNVLLALDRVDTDGPVREEPGAAYGVLFRHTLLRSDRGGVSWGVRRMTSRRTPEFFQPEDVNRTDWTVRARYELWDEVISEAFYHRSSVGVNTDRDGEGADTLITADARSQAGLRMAVDRGSWWAEAELRRQGGPGWPEDAQAFRGGVLLGEWVGAAAGVERQGWNGASGVNMHGRIWSSPILGITLFAEAESGRRAIPGFVPAPIPEEDPEEEDDDETTDETEDNGDEDDEEPDEEPEVAVPPRFGEMTGIRAGAEFRRGELFVGAALLSVDPDSLHPTGLPMDRGGLSMPGGRRTGVEISGRLPLTPILDGLSLHWDTQLWEQAPQDWRYTPDRTWDVRLRYHNVFFETRNLEVWTDVGMRGRDGMTVPLADPDQVDPVMATVPLNQSWYGRIQVRVVSAKIFVHWDNFTFRDNNQDFPGRILPQTRAMYGVKWTLWN